MIGKRAAHRGTVAWLVAFAALSVACRQDMHDAPRIDPLEASDFFADGKGARPLPAGTVARGHLNEDTHLHTGKDTAGTFVAALPAALPLTAALLERGRERYEIFCSPCHDKTGSGQGMIVRRGFKQPESYHTDRLRGMPIGYFFDVMTNGFGQMSRYAPQVPVADRWAIATYIRALQLSQNVPVESLSAAQAEALHASLTGDEQATADGHGDTQHAADHEDPYGGRSDAPEPGYGQALPIAPPPVDGNHHDE